jgi:hypothetical protein
MPRTVCKNILRQEIPDTLARLWHLQRLVLHAVISELGLVVIGSQIGRVALISLTRPEDDFSHHGPVTTFHVAKILPTRTQEGEERMRPNDPLLGFAVSPLQGQAKERKRWRLIMQYFDHSVLIYELSREGEELVVI